MESKRIEWVDVCRGLAILAIFIGHVGNTDIVTTFVFRYHIPLFFFLSGFFYNKRRILSIKEYLVECFKGTLIPYIFFCSLGIVFYIVTQGSPLVIAKTYLKQAFFGIRIHIDFGGQLWFFTCLFSIQILYYLLNRIIKKKVLLVIITLISALLSAVILKMPNVPSVFFNIDSALYYTLFYCVGDIVYPKIENLALFNKNLLHKRIIQLLCIIILMFTFYVYGKYQNFDVMLMKIAYIMPFDILITYAFQFFTIFVTFILIAANIIVSFALRQSKFLLNIGKNTLILCGLESISVIIVYSILSFLGINVKTDIILYKVIIVVLKVGIIKIVFFDLFNKYLPWVIGRKRTTEL